MKRIILIIFATFSIGVSALFDDDFNYTSDGNTLVCLNIKSTNIDRSVDIKYSDLWGVSTIEKLIVHIKSPKVLISGYTPSMVGGDYYEAYGGVFNIFNEDGNMSYIEFETVLTDKKGKKKTMTGKINRFTGDIHLEHIYGPCKKIERLL